MRWNPQHPKGGTPSLAHKRYTHTHLHVYTHTQHTNYTTCTDTSTHTHSHFLLFTYTNTGADQMTRTLPTLSTFEHLIVTWVQAIMYIEIYLIHESDESYSKNLPELQVFEFVSIKLDPHCPTMDGDCIQAPPTPMKIQMHNFHSLSTALGRTQVLLSFTLLLLSIIDAAEPSRIRLWVNHSSHCIDILFMRA